MHCKGWVRSPVLGEAFAFGRAIAGLLTLMVHDGLWLAARGGSAQAEELEARVVQPEKGPTAARAATVAPAEPRPS